MKHKRFRPWRIAGIVLLAISTIAFLWLLFRQRNVSGGMFSILKALFFGTDLYSIEGWPIPLGGGLEGLKHPRYLLDGFLFLVAAAGAIVGLISTLPKASTRRIVVCLCLGIIILLSQIYYYNFIFSFAREPVFFYFYFLGFIPNWKILFLVTNIPIFVHMALGVVVCLRKRQPGNKE